MTLCAHRPATAGLCSRTASARPPRCLGHGGLCTRLMLPRKTGTRLSRRAHRDSSTSPLALLRGAAPSFSGSALCPTIPSQGVLVFPQRESKPGHSAGRVPQLCPGGGGGRRGFVAARWRQTLASCRGHSPAARGQERCAGWPWKACGAKARALAGDTRAELPRADARRTR